MRSYSFVAALTLLGALPVARPAAAADAAISDADGERAHRRLAELFVWADAAPRVPTSPRFAALLEPGLRGTRVVIGWVLPRLDPAEQSRLGELVAALGPRVDGSLPAPLSALGPKLTVAVGLEAIRDVPLVTVDLALPRAGASRDLELALLRAVSDLAADETSPLAPLARRYLTPLARAVLELHPPQSAAVAVRVTKPLRHVIERGDTLSEIAENHGLDLEALVRLNGVDPHRPIHPGVALKLSDGGAPRPKLYVAKSGDTLAKVARHFGVSEKALLDANRLEARPLKPGQKLVLPR
jgi:LysM repeat protein